MAKKGGAKGKDKKGAEKKPKATRKLHSLYNVSGEKAERKNRNCPKCGPGMFLAAHKDRLVCGSCKYVEFTSKKEETVEESKTE